MRQSNMFTRPTFPGRARLAFALGLLLLGLGCARTRPTMDAARSDAATSTSIMLTGSGVSKFKLGPFPPGREPVGFGLQSVSDRPVRGIVCWDRASHSLLQVASAGEAPAPFALLPRERCGFTADATSSALARGLFLWELPASPEALRSGARSLAEISWNTTEGLVLTRRGLASRIELEFSSPLPHDRVRLGWSLEPRVEPEVWLSLNGEAWARQSDRGLLAPHADPWTNPLDLTTATGGQNRFFLRLIFPPPAGNVGNSAVRLRGLRVEREVSGPAKLRPLGAGIARVRLSTAPGSGPLRLELLTAD